MHTCSEVFVIVVKSLCHFRAQKIEWRRGKNRYTDSKHQTPPNDYGAIEKEKENFNFKTILEHLKIIHFIIL